MNQTRNRTAGNTLLMRIASNLYRKNSLYTDVLFFFSFFSRTSASSRAKRARENERGARERKIKNDRLFSSSQLLTP